MKFGKEGWLICLRLSLISRFMDVSTNFKVSLRFFGRKFVEEGSLDLNFIETYFLIKGYKWK